jgi:hypothetical protein
MRLLLDAVAAGHWKRDAAQCLRVEAQVDAGALEVAMAEKIPDGLDATPRFS